MRPADTQWTDTQIREAAHIATELWKMSVEAHHANARKAKYQMMDEHFNMVDRIARAQRPEWWEDAK